MGFAKYKGGYKLQLKEGFVTPKNLSGAAKDWAMALDRNSEAKNSRGSVKLHVDFDKKWYDGGLFNPNNNTAYIDTGGFNKNNILAIESSEVTSMPQEAQYQWFSLKRVVEHELLYHGIEELLDMNQSE